VISDVRTVERRTLILLHDGHFLAMGSEGCHARFEGGGGLSACA